MNYAKFLLSLSKDEYAQAISHIPASGTEAGHTLFSVVSEWAAIHYPNIILTC